jgi:hypothetical protein
MSKGMFLAMQFSPPWASNLGQRNKAGSHPALDTVVDQFGKFSVNLFVKCKLICPEGMAVGL